MWCSKDVRGCVLALHILAAADACRRPEQQAARWKRVTPRTANHLEIHLQVSRRAPIDDLQPPLNHMCSHSALH